MKLDAEVKGFDELDRAIRRLEPILQLRAVRRALVLSMNPMRKAARANLAPHRRSGDLAKGLKIRSVKLGNGRGAELVATLHTGRGFYGMFLEFGTRFQAPVRWFTRATDSSKDDCFEAFRRQLWEQIQRLSKR